MASSSGSVPAYRAGADEAGAGEAGAGEAGAGEAGAGEAGRPGEAAGAVPSPADAGTTPLALASDEENLFDRTTIRIFTAVEVESAS